MDEIELRAEIELVRDRARRLFWKRWATTTLPAMLVVFLAIQLTDPDNDSSVIGSVVGTLVGFAVAGVLLAVVMRWARQILPEPPLPTGLPRGRRRAVNRDLRRGEPNADPVLREVERLYVQRYRRNGRVAAWVLPVIAVAAFAFAVTNDGDTGYRVLALVFVAICLGATAYQVVLNRGMKAFADRRRA